MKREKETERQRVRDIYELNIKRKKNRGTD